MSSQLGNINLRSNCCETDAQFSNIYGCLPTGINPGNIADGTEPMSCLWSNIFGTDGWWEQSGVNVINPYNRDQQAPRNCINFRKKCRPNNRISLAEKGDCCGSVCESVIRELEILKRVPKVTHKTVTVLGPTKMCKNSVSPPIPIRNLWALYIEPSDQTVPQSSLFRFQVSKNGHSWTTLSDDYLVTTVGVAPTKNIYERIFNSDADGCGLNSNCLTCEGAPFAPHKNTANPQTFPDTNAFFATEGVDGLPRLPCPPNFCFVRIVACTAFCLQSFTATYANGGGFCSSVPLCPAGLVYDDKVCRPNPIRSCPGLPSSGVTGYCDPTNPDAGITDPAQPPGTPYRKHLHNSKINRKLFHVKDRHNAQLRQDESQHMRNVRALAGAPFNSRATNNGTGGLKFNPNAEGFLCGSGCPEDIGVRCGEGCGPDGALLPRPITCAVPARCRRPYATKHQTEDATLNKLVACAVAGCRKSGVASGASAAAGGGGGGLIPLANFIGGWRDTPSAVDYCVGQTEGVITTGIPIIPQILYLWAVDTTTPPGQLFLSWAIGYKNGILSVFDVSTPGLTWNQVATILTDPALGTDTSPTTTILNFIDVTDPTTTVLGLNTATVNCSLTTRIPATPPQPP